jgi:protein FAM50
MSSHVSYQVQVRKGDTIAKFLEKCRQSVDPIRGVHVDNLMYIKEDLIIPHVRAYFDASQRHC